MSTDSVAVTTERKLSWPITGIELVTAIHSPFSGPIIPAFLCLRQQMFSSPDRVEVKNFLNVVAKGNSSYRRHNDSNQ